MTSITIRDVPEETRNELASRAAATGRSLQEYLRTRLIEMASRPDQDALLARVRRRVQTTGTRISAREILELRDLDRR